MLYYLQLQLIDREGFDDNEKTVNARSDEVVEFVGSTAGTPNEEAALPALEQRSNSTGHMGK